MCTTQVLAIGGRGSFFFFLFFFVVFLHITIRIYILMNTKYDDTPESTNWDDRH